MNKPRLVKRPPVEYGPENSSLSTMSQNCQVHIAVHGWPCLVVGGRNRLRLSASQGGRFRMHVHRGARMVHSRVASSIPMRVWQNSRVTFSRNMTLPESG